MSVDYLSKARDFLLNEQQFHLGFLPTEQANPLSASLEEDYLRATAAGVRTLQRVDREVLKMAERVLASEQFKRLQQSLAATLEQGGKVVFSGCGATGRLSILLESMWRRACRKYQCEKYANSVFSIMTGGDYALVKSVESFEDFQSFGVEQVIEMGIRAGDLLVAITEGGETSSVLGTVREAISRGAQAFILFNNPAELLAEHLERSREVIRDPRVVVLDLFCGPMALAGSTRMQATTSEQLVAGAALESTMCRFLNLPVPDYVGISAVCWKLWNARTAWRRLPTIPNSRLRHTARKVKSPILPIIFSWISSPIPRSARRLSCCRLSANATIPSLRSRGPLSSIRSAAPRRLGSGCSAGRCAACPGSPPITSAWGQKTGLSRIRP